MTKIKPITLRTKRLILRSYHCGDEINLFQNYFSDLAASKYLQRHPHRNQTQTRQTLENWAGQKWEDSDPEFMWIIADHLTQQPMGILIFIQRHDIGEIHFGLGTPYQGQGLMCEAMTSVIQFLKQTKKLNRIETFCATEHLASRQVLEKTGFHKQQLLRAWTIFPLLGNDLKDCIQYILPLRSK